MLAQQYQQSLLFCQMNLRPKTLLNEKRRRRRRRRDPSSHNSDRMPLCTVCCAHGSLGCCVLVAVWYADDVITFHQVREENAIQFISVVCMRNVWQNRRRDDGQNKITVTVGLGPFVGSNFCESIVRKNQLFPVYPNCRKIAV